MTVTGRGSSAEINVVHRLLGAIARYGRSAGDHGSVCVCLRLGRSTLSLSCLNLQAGREREHTQAHRQTTAALDLQRVLHYQLLDLCRVFNNNRSVRRIAPSAVSHERMPAEQLCLPSEDEADASALSVVEVSPWYRWAGAPCRRGLCPRGPCRSGLSQRSAHIPEPAPYAASRRLQQRPRPLRSQR